MCRAYPRMRGGTKMDGAQMVDALGLSPHARGNPELTRQGFVAEGPIPACAGEPQTFAVSRSFDRAYPRMRGGTRIASKT